MKIQQRIENYLEVIESFESTNAQLLDSKIQNAMEKFTVLAFMTFPAMLFAAIYSVQDLTMEFWIGLGAVFFVTLAVTIIIFKRRGLF